MKKIVLICMMLMLVACVDVTNAADWPENINGRWRHGKHTFVDPYSGKTWYEPDSVYKFQLNGNELTIWIAEYARVNDQYKEKRSVENFLWFRGTLKGNRAQGTSYDWAPTRSKSAPFIKNRGAYDDTQTIIVSGDGNTLYWGNKEFRRE